MSDDNYNDLNSSYATRTDAVISYRLLTHLGDTCTDIKLQSFEVLGDHVNLMQHYHKLVFTANPYDFYGVDLTLDGELSYFTNNNAVIDEASRLHIEPKASLGYQGMRGLFYLK